MKETTKNLYFERMHTVLLHIQSNLDEEMNLDSLASKSFFSPVHFHRIFKGMMGETVVEHIRRIRLERAASRLAMGSSTVTDAAFDAGYETVESFSRKFKKTFGCPPSKYQDKHWNNFYSQMPGLIHYLPEAVREGLVLGEPKESDMDVKIVKVDPMHMIFIRHIGPYMECLETWQTLYDWAQARGLIEDQYKTVGICYDDPQVTPPDKLRYDACFTINDDTIEPDGEIGVQTLEGGEYAVVTHIGPYSTLEKTYAEFMGKWVPFSGREFREEPAFEIYHNQPFDTPPDELRTDIHLPLK